MSQSIQKKSIIDGLWKDGADVFLALNMSRKVLLYGGRIVVAARYKAAKGWVTDFVYVEHPLCGGQVYCQCTRTGAPVYWNPVSMAKQDVIKLLETMDVFKGLFNLWERNHFT